MIDDITAALDQLNDDALTDFKTRLELIHEIYNAGLVGFPAPAIVSDDDDYSPLFVMDSVCLKLFDVSW